jgi:hypothetical protein
MTKTKKLSNITMLIVAGFLLMLGSSCQKDEIPARKTTYALKTQDVLGVTGTATFIEDNNYAIIELMLFGAPSGEYTAELCRNTSAEGGTLVINLSPVNANEKSTTLVTAMTYDQLIAYDGHIRILKSNGEPMVILAQGDIGGNVITETKTTYTLGTIPPYGVAGKALFEKRKNGNTLVTINLTGTIEGEVYPATINLSSVATVGGGPVTKTLSSVNGTSGSSYTNIRMLDGGLNISYDNWLVYTGYINIYQTSVAFENIISQGNIGSNLN